MMAIKMMVPKIRLKQALKHPIFQTKNLKLKSKKNYLFGTTCG